MRNTHWIVAVNLGLALAGCGSDGSSDSNSTTTSLALNGTAATGMAMAGATVAARCASGTATATTAAGGSYSVSISSGSLPCVLEVTGNGGSPTYHSAVAGTGMGPFVVNASPLTELILAQIAGAAGTTPAALFSGFSTHTAAVTATALAAGVAYAQSALTGLVDLAAVNPLSDPLVAANGATPGNALDMKIDAFIQQLTAAKTTLDAVVATAIANPTTPATVTQATQTAAADCANLKTGSYRMINPFETDPLFRAHLLAIDASALTFISYADSGAVDATGNFASDGAGLCSFTTSSGTLTSKLMISSSGIVVAYGTDSAASTKSVAIGLPEQTVALSDLAGTYNRITFDKAAPAATINSIGFGLSTLDAAGHVTSTSSCVDAMPCTVDAGPFGSLMPEMTKGGFNFTAANGDSARLFAFKGAIGTLAVIAISNGPAATNFSGISLLAKVDPVVLPTLPFANAIWDMQLFGDHTLSALLENSFTYNSADAATGIVIRTRDDGRVDTRTYNFPRDGLQYRATNACSNSMGPLGCNGAIYMPFKGLGVVPYGSLSVISANPFLGLAVVKP